MTRFSGPGLASTFPVIAFIALFGWVRILAHGVVGPQQWATRRVGVAESSRAERVEASGLESYTTQVVLELIC